MLIIILLVGCHISTVPAGRLDRNFQEKVMNVSIIGAGNMARGIGFRLVEGGHTVALVDRDWKKANGLATDLGKDKPTGTVEVAGLDRALANPIVVLALPFAAAREFAGANAVKLAGKIVVDISNPLNASYDGL